MTNIVNTLSGLPEDSDEISCPECKDGENNDGDECTYCEGVGVISERKYQQIKRAENDDFLANQ